MHFVLIGKTCSGKTSILRTLRKIGMKTPVGVTTRPIREGEKYGVDNYFISDEIFKRLKREKKLIAPHHYKNAFGTIWSYAMVKKEFDVDTHTITILTPSGYKDLIEYFGKDEVFGFYLDVPYEERLERGLKRGDDFEELQRRLKADEEDFKDFEADMTIGNVDQIFVLQKILCKVAEL